MLFLSGSISGIGEVVAALVWADDVDQRADFLPSLLGGMVLARGAANIADQLFGW